MADYRHQRGRKLAAAKRERVKRKLIGAGILCLFVILFVQMAAASGKDTSAQITLAVNDITILQDETIPKMTATASCTEQQQGIVLDAATGYSVKDLVDSLNRGEGYTVTCEADGKEEGKFPITLNLDDGLKGELESKWPDTVYLMISDGLLKVKNKLGEWDGSRFKTYEGTYIENDFVESEGKTYYLGEDGNRVTGWQEINGRRYHFTKKGVMEKEVWKDTDDGKRYLEADGTVAIGWVKLDDGAYYFDEDGYMVTGEQRIGSSDCVFDEDGKLISRESKIDPDKPMMALTFDDGPGERTNELLDVLERNDAHATFFMLGQKVEQYPDEVNRMYEIGCELGNHSYNHPQLTEQGDGGSEQIWTTNELIRDASGHYPTVMRPPYGAYDDAVASVVGLPMILWNVDTLDWDTKNTQMTIDNVLSMADDGDIVLMHDIHSSTIDAAIDLIPRLIARGYQLVTVSEMAEARGIYMTDGVAYTDFNKAVPEEASGTAESE